MRKLQAPYKNFVIAGVNESKLSLMPDCIASLRFKNHVNKYCATVYERKSKNLFWSIKNSGEILNKLKSRLYLASSLSTYDYSTLYTTLPHNLINEKLKEFIE